MTIDWVILLVMARNSNAGGWGQQDGQHYNNQDAKSHP